MKEYVKIIKECFRLAKPKKFWTITAFFMVVLTQVCALISPIFAARLTLALTGGKFNLAIVYLIVVFIILLLRKTFWHVNYMVFTRIIRSSYNGINNEFVEKSLNAKLKNYKNTPKEKIINIVHSDVYTVSELADKLATASGRLFGLIVTIIVIFTVNVWAGLIVLVADVIDYFVLNWLHKKRSAYVKKIREDHDFQYEKFSEIVDTRESISDLGVENKVKKEYNQILNNYVDNLHKRTFWDSFIDNYYPIFYSFIILLATILLVVLVAGTNLPLETYFIIVSYITTGIETTNSIFGVIPSIRSANISAERVKTVLNFVERDEVQYGTNNLKDVLGSINFSHVYYKRDDEGNPNISDFDVLLKENETYLILGNRSCGKRTIFNLLRRAITPTKGTIYFDGVNILDYNKSSYRNNFCYVTTKPTFFKGSIMKNLQIIEKNRNIIYQTCKEIGIYDYIDKLPKKFNTEISALPYEKLYLLGLTRAVLTAAEVMVIYEFPSNLSDDERNNIKYLLDKMHGTRTIIIFSAQEYCINIADKVVEIEKGQIKQIQFNDKDF